MGESPKRTFGKDKKSSELAEVRHEISISGYLPCPQATSSFCSRVVFENAM
jgi:hypothetical protein